MSADVEYVVRRYFSVEYTVPGAVSGRPVTMWRVGPAVSGRAAAHATKRESPHGIAVTIVKVTERFTDGSDDEECEGHESTAGAIGETVYCDGTCL